MIHEIRLYIEGKWVESSSGETFDVFDPATGELVGKAASATSEDASKAVEAAHRAFPEWAKLPPPERGKILKKAAQLARERANDLGRLLTLEQGKPLGEAVGEINASADALEFFGEEGWRIQGDILPPNKPNRRSFVIKQPLGVVVAISPWNYPILLMAWKLGPALVTGNTVVAKPPSETPLALTQFIALLSEAGIPPGVINIVTGKGSVLGPALVRHPLTAKIAITGQTDTGRKVMSMAAEGIKKVSLELGGHTPFIVFRDADIEKAVKDGVLRSFRNMGQICNAVNRIYVHKSILPSFVEEFVEVTRKLTIDHGLNNPDLGSMCTRGGIEKTRQHIQDALSKGAKLLTGGKAPEGEKFQKGFFFEPTVLTDVNHSMLVMREETFGPVAPIMGFETVEEAIALANDSPFGLVSYVYTNDFRTILRVSEELQCGTVGINNVAGGEFPYPYGGWKESGLGVENSHYCTEQYLQLKHIRIEL
ncbi:MAG: NAD-dependent succinate-semialdehyde dehydrogenase [Anaerolineales bacterium]|nr:NAD-dependent succinate-semialdehyde dehydrogenase [Anaerolineales bacterium]MDW8447040.1 NAD-dependent succinate-semialdehyde dehydrogenase [Anaerolineales bacterium]